MTMTLNLSCQYDAGAETVKNMIKPNLHFQECNCTVRVQVH